MFTDANGNLVDPLSATKLFNRAVARARKELGESRLPRITLHGVRRTVGTLLHDWGFTPKAAAAFLGHTVAVYLAIYVKDVDHGSELAGALSARVRGSRVPESTRAGEKPGQRA